MSEEISKLFLQLRLKHWNDSFKRDISTMSPKETTLIMDQLKTGMETELAGRKASTIESRIRASRFRRIETVDAFDFSYSKATQAIKKTYLEMHQKITRESLPSAIFSGSAGLGKTHLARALGYAACQKGLSTLFITAAEMVNRLSVAQKTFTLESELRKYQKPQVLIIDELGYVTFDAQASNLFFQVISARHDMELGTIATTNLPFGKFNQIFANDAIAHAIVDRLVNQAEVFYLEGPSYREYQRSQKKGR